MPHMTLDEIFEHGARTAKDLFAAQGEVHPMWIAQTRSGEIMPIIAPISGPESKDAIIGIVKGIFKKNDVVRYVSLVEAWCLDVKDGTFPASVRLGAPISQHPERREIIGIQAEDSKDGIVTGMFFILRPEHGKAMLSPLKRMSEGTMHAGRFVGLLNQQAKNGEAND